MHGCNIFTCNKSHVGWHVGGQRHSSHHPTIRSIGLISTFSCNFWRCVIRQYSCHDITMMYLNTWQHTTFNHKGTFYFNPQFLVLSVISIFSCLVRSVKYKSYDRDRNWTLNLLIWILALYPLSYGDCRSSESFTYIWTFGVFVNSC